MRKNPALMFAASATIAFAILAVVLEVTDEGPAKAASPAPAEIARLASAPEVASALSKVDASAESLIADWIQIASTPASSGQEESRADLALRIMRAAGLEGVRRDGAGNVSGAIPGRDRRAKKVVFMAHMDTVARIGADFTVRRENGRLHAPGVRDDSSGLAAILAAARLVRESRVVPPVDVLVVASAREEVGLKGAEAFLETTGRDVGAFVAVDGYLGQISYAATAIIWFKMHFKAPGAHTLKSHESPSATLAAAKAIEGIYAITVPRAPVDAESWVNVGMMGGGEVPNAQARDAWFTVDLRSNDPVTTADLESKVMEACRRAAAEVGVTFEPETLQRLKGARIEGHRDSTLVRTAQAVLDHLGWHDVLLTPRGAADSNIAIRMGIPAIALGVATGDGAHTPEEFADIGPYFTGVKQLILLMAAPLY